LLGHALEVGVVEVPLGSNGGARVDVCLGRGRFLMRALRERVQPEVADAP
jgi:hypothetical protein